MSDRFRNTLLAAAKAHFESKRATSFADLSIYLAHPVGIGEHSEVVAEVIRKVEDIAHAEDCLSIVNKYLEEGS